MKARMHKSTCLKREFLKKWIKGLQMYNNFKKEMSILERKKAIKLSADLAIASTRNGRTRWSRTLMANISRNETNKILVQQQFPTGSEIDQKKSSVMACSNRIASKRILRRSHVNTRRNTRKVLGAVKASSIAKKLVKNRTQLLKSLVPGGESMDEVSLIKETLDYIVSLRVQVDVMRRLATAAEHSTRPQSL